MISGRQIRAARAFLIWDQRDLSRKAVVPLATIEHIESGATVSGDALVSAVSAIQVALKAEGIDFTDDNGSEGVRLHPRAKRVRKRGK